MRPAGKGLGGEGSCETGMCVEAGMDAGRARHPVTQRATAGVRTEIFIVTLCRVKGRKVDMSLRESEENSVIWKIYIDDNDDVVM